MVIGRITLIAFTLLTAFPLRAGAQADDPSASPSGPTPERARALFVTGVAKAQAEQWKAAEEDFRASYALVARPSTLYNLALVLYRQSQYQESAELCDALLASSDPAEQVAYRTHAQALLARIRDKGATVSAIVVPEGAAWAIDGRDVAARGPRRQAILAAGPHVFDFSADGFESRRVELVVAEGDRHTLTVELPAVAALASTPPPAPAEAKRALGAGRSESSHALTASGRTPQWLLLGTGGALLAAATVTGLMALSADAEFEEKCPALRDCDPSLSSLQERTGKLSAATDVLLVSGGLVAGSALVWLLLTGETQPEKTSHSAVDTTVSSHGLTLRARF
jgi:hypothetical protein